MVAQNVPPSGMGRVSSAFLSALSDTCSFSAFENTGVNVQHLGGVDGIIEGSLGVIGVLVFDKFSGEDFAKVERVCADGATLHGPWRAGLGLGILTFHCFPPQQLHLHFTTS